jgi:putative ABC transport system permease protein
MSLFGIAWRTIRQRLLTSGLTALSLALGVALVVATLVIGNIVTQAFKSGSGLGYNMIVGAKGSPLQLVLNSVYLVSKPIENISWAFYEEFLPAASRPDGVAGTFAGSVQTAVPICMGDYFSGYRVIGTSASYFDRLTYGGGAPSGLPRWLGRLLGRSTAAAPPRAFAFAEGRNFRDDEFFGGVLGCEVAAKLGLKAGDPFAPTHGADDGLVHDPFTVTGVLARTDTPVDRGVYVNMEGFYLQEGHAKPVEGATAAKPMDHASGTPAPLPREQREVTAILVETVSLPGLPAELTAMALKTQINEGRDGQAAEPIREISVLLGLFVRPLELLLLLVTTLVVIVSAIGILVSMVGSSLERSRDVAVMRALGASRGQVLATVLIEAVILALGGGLAGWALGHVLVAAIGPLITTNAGVSATVLSAAPTAELLLVPFLIALAILAALMPALAAYRTDVAKWLG